LRVGWASVDPIDPIEIISNTDSVRDRYVLIRIGFIVKHSIFLK
jgi:hypothetical protein